MILLASSRSKKTAFIFPTPPRHFFAQKGIFFFSIFSTHVTSWHGGSVEYCQEVLYQELWDCVIFLSLLSGSFLYTQSKPRCPYSQFSPGAGRAERPSQEAEHKQSMVKKDMDRWGWSRFATNSPDGPEWFCAAQYYPIYLHPSTNWSMATSQHCNRKLTAFTEIYADLLTVWAKLKLHFSANKLVVFAFSFTFLFAVGKNIFCK